MNGAVIRIFAGTVLLVVFVSVINFFQAPIKSAFNFVAEPSRAALWSAGSQVSGFFFSFLSGSLLKENEQLKEENEKLLCQISSFQVNEKINKEIEGARAVFPKDFQFVVAGISGFNSDQDIIFLDKGSDDGISEGMPVIDCSAVLYGKISKSYKNYSEVLIISAKDNVIDVKVMQENIDSPVISGALKGRGGLSVYLDLVPTDEEIKKGDILLTSALEKTLPVGLLVGRIVEDHKNDLKPFQQAQIEPFFDIKKVENLFVITNHNNKKDYEK